MSQPPPPPETYKIPFSAPQTFMSPPSLTFQPLRSAPLKSAVKPSGGLTSSARTAETTTRPQIRTPSRRRDMGRNSSVTDRGISNYYMRATVRSRGDSFHRNWIRPENGEDEPPQRKTDHAIDDAERKKLP